MTATISDIFTQQSHTLREEIGSAAYEFMPEIGGSFFADMMMSDIDVVNGSVIGRDWLIKRRFYGGYAGIVRGGNTSGNLAIYGDQGKIFGSATAASQARQNLGLLWRGLSSGVSGPSAFVNPLEAPNPRPFGLTTRLYSVDTALPLSLSLLQLEALPANIKQEVAPVMRGWAKNIAHVIVNSFFQDRSQQMRLASVGPSTGDGAYSTDSTQKTLTFYPVEKATHRFAVGMAVDVFTGTTRINQKGSGTSTNPDHRVRCFVQDVDHWSNKVVLVFDPSEVSVDGTAITFANMVGASNANIGESAFVVYANTYGAYQSGGSASFGGWYSWSDWLKNSGNLLGTEAITTNSNDYIDVGAQSQFKSGLYSSVGALNEVNMVGMLENVERSLDPWGYFIDTIIASSGTLLSVFDQTLAALRINVPRTGQVASMNNMGLADGLVYTTPSGRRYRIYESRMLQDGYMVGFRKSGNWEMVVPPNATGTTRTGLEGLPRQIPLQFFMDALTGGAGNRFPLTVNTGGVNLPTEYTGIFGFIRCQLQPKEQIPGCVWTGVNTTRYFSA